jgi:type I restriction enzyme R subunit
MSQSDETQPRARVDAALAASGWALQDGTQPDPKAAYAVAVRRFPLAFSPTHGNSDYLLYIQAQPVGVIRILPQLPPLKNPDEDDGAGYPATQAEPESDERVLPSAEPMHWEARKPVERRLGDRSVFVYETDGQAIHFRDARDEPPRPRMLFHFHRPSALAAWLAGHSPAIQPDQPSLPPRDEWLSHESMLQRFQTLARVADRSLWAGERLVLEALQTALRRGHRRILAQMTGGSGKTHTLLNLAYLLIENAKAARVLLLVDNDPLAYQTAEEFRALRPPAQGSPTATPLPIDVFPESHQVRVQQLSGKPIDPDARLVIGSPYRLLSYWHQDSSPHTDLVARTLFSESNAALLPNAAATYNSHVPMETFDVILCDDLSADTYAALDPLLSYFDAPVAALCATPSAETLALFGPRIVAEYPHEQAIADGAILPFETYAVRLSADAEQKMEAQAGPLEIHRETNGRSRLEQWSSISDRAEVSAAPGTVEADLADFTLLLTLRDRLPREIFPGRTQLPKTLLIARDDAHAAQLLELVREVFSPEEYFARILTLPAGDEPGEITDVVFRAHSTKGRAGTHEPRTPSPDARYPHLTNYRADVFPRIGIVPADSFGVTVDLRPTELLVIMAPLSRRSHFEAIKSRCIRTVRRAEFLRVTTDGHPTAGKTHGVIADFVGMFDQEAPSETFPLNRRPAATTAQLLQEVAFGGATEHTIRSLAARFLQLDCLLNPQERDSIAKLAGGTTLHTLAVRLIASVDPERHIAHAARSSRGGGSMTQQRAVEQAGALLMQQAASRLHSSTELRSRIIQLERQYKPRPVEPEEAPILEDIGNEETWR